MHIAATVFIDIAIIIVFARVFGRIAIAVGQPPVVGEIVAGLSLGPSLLGLLPGDLETKLFPPEVLPYLDILAQLGLILFMFIVGLELDMAFIRGREKIAGTISFCSILVPFGLGALLALLLHDHHDQIDGSPVPLLGLILFMGVAMSITAFPVLARILTDRGMHRTSTGAIALACAAVDDIIAWTLLALVVAVVQGNGPGDVLRIVALTAAFAAFMFLVVRRLLVKMLGWYRRAGRLTPDILAVVLIGVLASSYLTEIIGIHSIFGAFIFGAIMPRADAADLTREVLERLEQVSVLLLLPLFFVVTGFGVNVAGITASGLWQLGLILVVAIGGKFIGAYAGAKLVKVPGRQASALSILMNTRGLTELVILNIGKQLGVLDDELFTMMVLMALITTAMTGPLLKWVYPDRAIARDIAIAERASLGICDSYRVLVMVDDPARAARLAAVGASLLGSGRPAQLVLDRLITTARSKSPLEVGAGLTPDLNLMAATVDELNKLGASMAIGDATVSVLCRFSNDPWADLLNQAEVVEADVIVIDSEWSELPAGGFIPSDEQRFSVLVARLAEDGTATLADPTRPVLAVVDGSDSGRTALVMAAWAALGRGSGLLVHAAEGARAVKRYSTALTGLQSHGMKVEVVERLFGDERPALVLHPSAAPFKQRLAAPILAVTAGADDRVTDLADQLGKLIPAQAEGTVST